MAEPRPPRSPTGRAPGAAKGGNAAPESNRRTPTAPGAARRRNTTTAATQRPPAKQAPVQRAPTTRTQARRGPSVAAVTARALANAEARETSLDLVHVPAAHVKPELADDAAIRHGDVDEWGRSATMRKLAARLYDPIYSHWFRAEWDGLEKIPTDGGALLVANHAGAIPSDAPAIMHGIEKELDRPVYGLADYLFRKMPLIGTMWSRLGGLPAHPDNVYRLLREQKQLVLVFPEGTKGPSKHVSQRYHLARFGRGGFVEIAMRAGVPVVPIAVVGAEESMPIVAKVPAVAKATGLPYVPITVNMLMFGPLGTLLYYPAKFKLHVLDPVYFNVEPDQERYSKSRIMDESEKIRESIQQQLYSMLRERRSIWGG